MLILQEFLLLPNSPIREIIIEMTKSERYADLERQEEALHAQISKLRNQLDAVHLKRVILGDAIRVKIVDGGVYRKPGVDQTLTVRREENFWNVYDENGLQKNYYNSDSAARDLGKWGAKLVA